MSNDITKAAMKDPNPGDRFSELHQFWVEVLAVEDGVVAVRETPDPLGVREHGYRFFKSVEAFQWAYAHKGEDREDYWIEFEDAKGPVWKRSVLQLILAGKDQMSADEVRERVESTHRPEPIHYVNPDSAYTVCGLDSEEDDATCLSKVTCLGCLKGLGTKD